ncbi:MAG: hypothetical protein IIB17_08120 [Chloroflexi bacterium]|nr:hypothetical protein [Chloroflexota bacterium]
MLADDRQGITIPTEIKGVIDYTSDTDRFSIELERGDSIEVVVETFISHGRLMVGFAGAPDNQRLQAVVTQASSLAYKNQITYRAPFTGEYVLSVIGDHASGFGYMLSVARSADDTSARTVEPDRFPRPAQTDERTESEKSRVQDALTSMMADMGLSEMASSTNSVNSWSHYPSGDGASALHPDYLDEPTTGFFYCWDTDGTISYQFTSYAVCPPPPLPPGTPYDGMRQSRSGHTATLLPSGDVLVVGGTSGFGESVSSAETFLTASEKWTTAGSIIQSRIFHTATLLGDGNVLISGGQIASLDALASVELYDWAVGNWATTTEMSEPRILHTATKLSDGTALITGGFRDFDRTLDTAEIYDPASETWNTQSPMSAPRALHTMTLLADGRILVIGGLSDFDNVIATAEVFDPSTGIWTPTGSMASPRLLHSATLLSDGRVLVTGGLSDIMYETLAPTTAEVYDPATGEWESAGRMFNRSYDHTATLLADGRVLVTGGQADFETLRSVEIYDPVANDWSVAEALTDARSDHTATLLEDGRVIVIGGGGDFGGALNSSEIYDPMTDSWTYMKGSESLLGDSFGGLASAPAPATPAPASAPIDHPRPAPTLSVVQVSPVAPAPAPVYPPPPVPTPAPSAGSSVGSSPAPLAVDAHRPDTANAVSRV